LLYIMKKLYARTENDFEDQTFKALPARSSGLHLDLRLETLETSDAAGWKSGLCSALVAPPVYSNVSREQPLPPRRCRIPVIFLGPLPQEKEQPVPIQCGPVNSPAKKVTKRNS